MNDPNPRNEQKSADSLSQPGQDAGIELNEKQLDEVAGAASDTFAKLGDIKGESIDSPPTRPVIQLTHETRG